MILGMVIIKTGEILDMEEAEVAVAAAEAAATNPEVDTKEVDTNSKAMAIMEETTMVAGETRVVAREEVDMAAVVTPAADGAIDVMTTGITIMKDKDPMISAEITGIRAAEVASMANLAETKVRTNTPTLEAQTSDHELQDHQEAMHQSLERTHPKESKVDQAASFT